MATAAFIPVSEHEPLFRSLDGPVLEQFDCGSEPQSDFYTNDAWEHQQKRYSRTFVMYYKGMKAGFLSLSPSEIQLGRKERPPEAPFATFPALKIVQMGLDKRFQGLKLGPQLVYYAIARARAAEDAYAYVILDSRPEVVGFYKKLGFEENERATTAKRADAEKHGRDPAMSTVSMRFDLREVGQQELPSKASTGGGWMIAVASALGLIVGWRRKH